MPKLRVSIHGCNIPLRNVTHQSLRNYIKFTLQLQKLKLGEHRNTKMCPQWGLPRRCREQSGGAPIRRPFDPIRSDTKRSGHYHQHEYDHHEEVNVLQQQERAVHVQEDHSLLSETDAVGLVVAAIVVVSTTASVGTTTALFVSSSWTSRCTVDFDDSSL